MIKYIKYLRYVMRHKYYVMIECFKRGLILQGLMHDMSKLSFIEFVSYANFFYGKIKNKASVRKNGYYKPTDTGDKNFDRAWLHHIHKNKHHWQYWILAEDDGGIFYIEIPEKYIIEMVCDWIGAGKAQKNKISCKEWYALNKHKIKMHDKSREFLENYLDNRA